nr:saccharopine dehydrogenase NADP-binding domain-containing protein [uncultured Desulfobacter sp.]
MSEKKKKIGILGGYGMIGLDACRWLIKTTPHDIIIGGRDSQKGMRAVENLDGAASFIEADVNVPSSIEAFCSACNVVVNCTGPSRLVLDAVAKIALDKEVDYVDPSGDEPLYNILCPHDATIRDKGLRFILSAGVYPGLSELLPDYIIKNTLDHVDRMEYYYCAWGELSFGSAYDYICTLEEGTGQGWVHLRDGKKEKSYFSQDMTMRFPPPVETMEIFPLLTEGLLRVAKEHNINTIHQYVSIGKNLLSSLLSIIGEKSYKTDFEKEQSARMLMESAAADMENFREDLKTAVMFHIIMDGQKNGTPQRIETNLFHPHGARLTSIVVAITALLVAQKAFKPGCHYVEKGIDVSQFMQLLKQQEINFDQAITGRL